MVCGEAVICRLSGFYGVIPGVKVVGTLFLDGTFDANAGHKKSIFA